MYPDAAKIDKQFKHAERKGVPFVVKEINNEIFVVKDLKLGEQMFLDVDHLITILK